MKIVFTGGGTGGHFYPIIAVAEAVRDIAAERHLITPRLFYIAPTPYDEDALFSNEITYIPCKAGKMRRYASILNVTDMFVTLWGTIGCVGTLFRIYPDVVFSKGGFASVPVVLAASLLRIPIIIHESDAKPGRANLLGAKYAKHIGVAFDNAIQYFPKKVQSKIARTGIPLRKALGVLDPSNAVHALKLDSSVPTVLILGGSSGSQAINETVLGALESLVGTMNVIHQTGRSNFADVEKAASVILGSSIHKDRYHVYPFLNIETLRQAAGAAHVVVSRAGATSIAEIALWRRPSILIPIPESISHDQRTNAYAYARTGAASVLEQANMTPHILASEITRIARDPNVARVMVERSAAFGNENAARIIAEDLMRIALSHEPENQALL
ncbi:MAG TPA: UDP-N-acetylglucosamine--N-acetylmuramyl-(pentapeptide) pyrophosphoryl-undecaprenol N-acetylglucosamine transferase [Candidatus Paceibacterota bacterium]|nr:UDP-N-acetylglucosamine--N-acetylmuramyl-(pentapeptide) pyrophosphoryl-undecaprenol N-acetylglucosamine transferase [Candidatus Paceibacterota bacterium]